MKTNEKLTQLARENIEYCRDWLDSHPDKCEAKFLSALEQAVEPYADALRRLIKAISQHMLCGVPELKTVDDVVKAMRIVADKMIAVSQQPRVEPWTVRQAFVDVAHETEYFDIYQGEQIIARHVAGKHIANDIINAHNASIGALKQADGAGYERCLADIQNGKLVLHERQPRVEPWMKAVEMAWTIIANVSGGDWLKQSQDWQDAAARWRDTHMRDCYAHNASIGVL